MLLLGGIIVALLGALLAAKKAFANAGSFQQNNQLGLY